jgi:hypothetical protein
MKSFLLRREYFFTFGTLRARRTKPEIKNYRGIKELGFIDKHEPVTVTSTRSSDSPWDSRPCDSAI